MVVDLGSGAGMDCFIAAKQAGPRETRASQSLAAVLGGNLDNAHVNRSGESPGMLLSAPGHIRSSLHSGSGSASAAWVRSDRQVGPKGHVIGVDMRGAYFKQVFSSCTHENLPLILSS